MSLRTATIAVCALDTAAWLIAAVSAFASGSDAATRGLDQAAGLAITALYLLTGAPALALTVMRRAPVAALVLALAFPATAAALFVAAMLVFA